eukprot:scaffold62706_cov48-Cyclotella_meneghiniana.AAC.9
MFNAFHPAPLDPIERTLVEESVDERSLHKPSGPDYPGNHHFAVDERSLHKPSGPVENVGSPVCTSQCRQCVIGNVPFYASPLKFTFQKRHKTSHGLVKGHRRLFYIPDPSKDLNTIHAFDIKNKRVTFILKCRRQVFLECTTFPFHSLSNEARGCMVMFRSHGLKNWKLGIIRAMMYGVELINGKKVHGVVRLYEWVGNVIPGTCAGNRLDLFYSYYDITELTEGRLDGHQYKNRLVEREYHLGKDDDHFDIVFINKVMGEVEISDRLDTVNPIDGCVQHSSLGPNKFHLECTPIQWIYNGHGRMMPRLPKGVVDYYKKAKDGHYCKSKVRKSHLTHINAKQVVQLVGHLPSDSWTRDLETLADSVVELFCANEIVRGSWECTNAVIYAGNCAPPLTYQSSQGEDEIPPVTNWEAFRTPLWYDQDEQHQHQYENLTTPGIVRYMLNSSGMFQDYPAVSKIIRSTAFHARKIDRFQINMAKLAFGRQGSYKIRHGSVGFNAYPNSLRNDTVASAISPNCGPDHLSNCTYYLHDETDVRIMPYLHSLSSQLNEGIITNFKTDYHHLRCTEEIKSSNRINKCHMHSILTVDFANHTHVDRQDGCYAKWQKN